MFYDFGVKIRYSFFTNEEKVRKFLKLLVIDHHVKPVAEQLLVLIGFGLDKCDDNVKLKGAILVLPRAPSTPRLSGVRKKGG